MSTQNYSNHLQYGVIDPEYKYSIERVKNDGTPTLEDDDYAVESGTLNISQRSSSQYFNESQIQELH